jgi:Co/Zn/Cd efflux system component
MLKPINGKMRTNCCESDCHGGPRDRGYRRVLWVALAVNIIMFAIELIGSCRAGSVSLQADALDFLGDAGNYALTLAVAGRALPWRASAALLKGGVMGLFGIWVAGSTLAHAVAASMPKPAVMGAIALLALGANLAVAALLYRYRRGDSQAVSDAGLGTDVAVFDLSAALRAGLLLAAAIIDVAEIAALGLAAPRAGVLRVAGAAFFDAFLVVRAAIGLSSFAFQEHRMGESVPSDHRSGSSSGSAPRFIARAANSSPISMSFLSKHPRARR